MWAGPKKPEASSIGELLLCLGIREGGGEEIGFQSPVRTEAVGKGPSSGSCNYGETRLLSQKGCRNRERVMKRHSSISQAPFEVLSEHSHWPIPTGSQKTREYGWCCLQRSVPWDTRSGQRVKNKWWVGTENNFAKENNQHYICSTDWRNTGAEVIISPRSAKSIPTANDTLCFLVICDFPVQSAFHIRNLWMQKGQLYYSTLDKGLEHPRVLLSAGVLERVCGGYRGTTEFCFLEKGLTMGRNFSFFRAEREIRSSECLTWELRKLQQGRVKQLPHGSPAGPWESWGWV